VLALAAFTGSAFAGGNGNGSGSSNGNSANAPGHQDSATPTPAAPATAQAPAQPPAKASKQSPTSATQPATGGDNSHGVKPSSTTKHDTYAKASSDQTKQYGNGKTAGQIATQAGYGDATLHGPGNSQPHKTLCGGHEVDVHALKNKGSKCGTVSSVKPESKPESKPETKTETKTETKSEPAQAPQVCATTTQTVTVQGIVGVKHMIGPKGSGRFVIIHPSLNAAHYDKSKHPDDVVLYGPVTTTVTVPAANCSSTATPSTPAVSGSTPASSTQITAQAAGTVAPAAVAPVTVAPVTAAGVAPATATPATSAPAVAGGVKGAIIALHPTKKAKPAGGVLGTTTRLGNTVGAAKLPFTGLPLWIFTLAAAGLIGLGVALRRTSADRV
jgi:hypothetical protein